MNIKQRLLSAAFIVILLLVISTWYYEKNSPNVVSHMPEDSLVPVEDFSGSLEIGHRYQATWPIDALILARLPRHHAFHIEWKKIADLPNPNPGSQFIFKVLSKETSQAVNQNRWNDEYVCEVFKTRQ